MKKLAKTSHLKFNKQTIATLNRKSLREVQGGSWYTITTITDFSKNTLCTSDV
jgi:hypothetical protein